MKNIEVKVSIDDMHSIKSRLEEMGAKFKGVLKQVDTYYLAKKGRVKIREINNNKFELIYYNRPDRSRSKISDYEIVKLTRKQADTIKDALKEAFGEKVVVRKVRNLWTYKHTRIHLDSVHGLGRFLELETVVDKITETQAQAEYDEIFKRLEISKYMKQKKSYSDLLNG